MTCNAWQQRIAGEATESGQTGAELELHVQHARRRAHRPEAAYHRHLLQ